LCRQTQLFGDRNVREAIGGRVTRYIALCMRKEEGVTPSAQYATFTLSAVVDKTIAIFEDCVKM